MSRWGGVVSAITVGPLKQASFHADELLTDPELDLLIEVIDDPAEAFRQVGTALRQGRLIVTANKAMAARHLTELVQLEFGGTLLYEAAVCGSIPIIRTLDNYFSHEPLLAVSGIFNGSFSYVLTRMSEHGTDYGPALAEAQAKGFAESTPSLDMGGFDSRSKAVILAAYAFSTFLIHKAVLNLGIEGISAADITYAAARGQKIKVVAGLYCLPNGSITALVTPQLVGPSSPLFAVENEFNGVAIEAAFAGTQFLRGRGAGGHPTGSSVLALQRGFRYGYAKSRPLQDTQLNHGLEAEFYLRHADVGQLRATLKQLKPPIESLLADEHGPYAIGEVLLQRLHQHRNCLREAGLFVARLGEVRATTPVAQAAADGELA